MQITRIYYNAADDVIRLDQITRAISKPKPVLHPRLGNDPGLQMELGPELVKTTILGSGTTTTLGSRVVAKIEITGDFDDWDKTGGAYNILWATKTLGSGQIVKFDMSNLARNGDTV